MSEDAPSRDEALASWTGYSNVAEDPADLEPLNRPESADDEAFKQAKAAYDVWYTKAREEAGQDRKLQLEVAVSASTFFVDAGFSGIDYLDEVANDWLLQSEVEAEDNGWADLAAKIKARRDEINQRIGRPTEDNQ